MDKIRPCLYCKNEEVFVNWTETDCDGTFLYQVACARCGALGPVACNKELAIKLHNREVK